MASVRLRLRPLVRSRSFLLYLLLLLFPVCVCTSLSTTTHRERSQARHAASRATEPRDALIIPQAPAPTPDGTLLVSTLDGMLHALDLRSGEYLWKFGAGTGAGSGGGMVSSTDSRFVHDSGGSGSATSDTSAREWNGDEATEKAGGTVRGILQRELNADLASHDLVFDQDEDEHSAHPRAHAGAAGSKAGKGGASGSRAGAANSSAPLMIPGVDGSLFYSGTHGLQRLPINVAELVEAAPFRTGDNTRYLGYKEVNVFLIDRTTGALRRVFSPRHAATKFGFGDACDEDECDPNLIWVAKSDLMVHALDGRSGKLRWNVSMSTYAPFESTEGGGQLSEAELDRLGVPTIGASVGGTVHSIDVSAQRVHWAQALHSPVTAVFLVRPESALDRSTPPPPPREQPVDDGEGIDVDDSPRSAGPGDLIRLPHFYFSGPEGDESSTQQQSPPGAHHHAPMGSPADSVLNEIIASYYYSRDQSDVLTYTYIGQTQAGLIYALPNPTPIPSSTKIPLFIGGSNQGASGSGRGGSTGKSPLAIGTASTPSGPSAGKPSIPAVGDAASSAATPSHTSTTSAAADDACIPSSPSYPRCLVGFHALGVGAGASGGELKPQLLLDFYNHSVRPLPNGASSGHSQQQSNSARDDDEDDVRSGSSSGFPSRDRDRDSPENPPYREWDVPLPNNPNGGWAASYWSRPGRPGFRDSLMYFWPLVAFTIVTPIILSLSVVLVWRWMGSERRQRWGDATRQKWPAKWGKQNKQNNGAGGGATGNGGGGNNPSGGTKKSGQQKKKQQQDANANSNEDHSPGDGGDHAQQQSGFDDENELSQSGNVRRRLKRVPSRNALLRQSSDPSGSTQSSSGAASSTNSPSSSSLTPNASGTLVPRKTHWSTYETVVSHISNLLPPALRGGKHVGVGAGATSSGSGSGDTLLIKPRKHIQVKPDPAKLNSDAIAAPALQRSFSSTRQNADGSVSIGSSIVLFPSQVLGTGSMGTIVYSGTFEGRPCAIKRLVKPFFGSANAAQEIALLIQSDQHPNVLRYYAKDEDQSFIYLALEQCVGTIQDLVDSHTTPEGIALSREVPQVRELSETIQILHGLMTGLAHLHRLHIVHRDIKPGNLLLTKAGVAKLADMGLGKQLSLSRSSFDSVVSGSVGWQAPEVLNAHGGRLTKAVDVFSAGCVMHFVLTKGLHPFGENVERELNIAHGRMDLSALSSLPEARDLVGCMLHPCPSLRLSADDAVAHPFFWLPDKQLSFLLEASDRFESESEHSELRMCLESQAAAVVGVNWQQHLDQALLDNLGKYRKYDCSSVRDCLRVIRNKKNHYRDLPLGVREALGPLPGGFLKYFTSRFPALLVYVYSVLACFCLESPASSPGDPCSYSPLDLDTDTRASLHADGAPDAEARLEAVQQFYHKPLRDYPELRFSSPQMQHFYADISLRRLVQLQKHTRLRFRHWYVEEDRWMQAGRPPASSSTTSVSSGGRSDDGGSSNNNAATEG